MKECKYCRTKYDDNLSACPNCGGTKVITAQEKAEDAALYQKEIENRENAVAVVVTKRKMLISVLVGILVLIIAVIALVSYNANKPLSNGMTKDEGEKILAEGITFYNDGNYESAIECFMQLPSDSKQYEKAQSMIAKCEDEYSASVVEKANGYATNGEYKMALNLLKNADELLPNNAAISDAYNVIFAEYKELICGNAYSEAEVYVSNGDYPSAIATIDNAISLIGQEAELLAKLQTYKDKYKENLKQEAKDIYYTSGYAAAIEHLKAAQNSLAGDSEFEQLIEEYMSCAPIGFNTIAQDTLYAGDQDWTIVEKMQINGALDYFFDVLCSHGTAKYALNGKYERISGTFVYNGDKSQSSSLATRYCSPVLNLYCDDVLAYTVTLTTNKKTASFNVDLKDVNYLTIELKDTYQSYAFGIDHYTSGIMDFFVFENVIQ